MGRAEGDLKILSHQKVSTLRRFKELTKSKKEKRRATN
jgi:hypothetical protein